MTTIVTRAGKGSPLTHVEVDTNFTNLNTNKLEAGAIALGSAGTPSVSFVSDANTGIFSPGADQVAISTGGTSRLSIDASGNVAVDTNTLYVDAVNNRVAIGTTGPDSALHIVSTSAGADSNHLILANASSTAGTTASLYFAPNQTGRIRAAAIKGINMAGGGGGNPTDLAFFTNTDGSSPTEKVRIDGSGRLLVGTSSYSGANLLQVNSDALVNSLTVGRGPGNDSNTTVLGNAALAAGISGTGNVAIGRQAVNSLTTGSYNTGVGYLALSAIVGNSGSIMIGGVTSAGSYSPANNITASNRISIGSTSVTDAFIQVAWTVVSDARDKTNFAPVPHGLDFVTALKPTAFQFKLDRESSQPNGRVRYGFKAQDILELEGENGIIINSENPEKLYYNGESLIPVLVNAIKELSAKNNALEVRLAALEAQ